MADETNNGSTPPATETTANPTTADSGDITEVLRFDPFASKDANQIPEVVAPAKTPGKPDDASAGGDETVPPVTPVTPVTKTAESATPPADNEAYRQIAEQLATIASSAGKPPVVEEPEDTGPKKPAFSFNIPDQLVAVLSSADPKEFKQGLAAFGQGVAQAVFEQTVAYQEALYAPRFDSLPAIMLQAVQQMNHNKTVESDFYGTYKELDNPMLRPVVKQVGAMVAKELGKTVWDAELRDATATRVKQIMAIAAGQNAQPTVTPPVPRARMMTNQGSRPAVNNGDAEQRDIVDTLFSDF